MGSPPNDTEGGESRIRKNGKRVLFSRVNSYSSHREWKIVEECSEEFCKCNLSQHISYLHPSYASVIHQRSFCYNS